MGRWSLVALVVNSIIGSAIFGLPGEVAALLGKYSPLGYLAAAAGVALVIATFAEVSSRFSGAGGPYLYAREAFGPFVGIQMAWLLWLVRLTAVASGANLFVTYLGEFWPAATDPVTRALVLTLLIGGLAAVNVRGAAAGAGLSNVFAISKLTPLAIFIVAGGAFLIFGSSAASFTAMTPKAGIQPWLEAVLILVFAYGGYESALVPMAEAKDPKRDAPFALFASLIICIVVYTLVQVVVMGLLPDPSLTKRPLATAARVFWGTSGAVLMTAGALISLYGYLAANTLNTPRLTFALAEHRDFPQIFAQVHPRFRTPYVSIAFYATVVLTLSIIGTFKWNLMLSSVSRLFSYLIVFAALFVLRRRDGNAPFHVPGGKVFAVLGALFSLALISQMGKGQVIVMLATAVLAWLTWLWAHGRRADA
ncbi:MAG TPA: APC family permease [Terriglobales bacterium]|nr:APC family permease [Terriglobales bacterium]